MESKRLDEKYVGMGLPDEDYEKTFDLSNEKELLRQKMDEESDPIAMELEKVLGRAEKELDPKKKLQYIRRIERLRAKLQRYENDKERMMNYDGETDS